MSENRNTGLTGLRRHRWSLRLTLVAAVVACGVGLPGAVATGGEAAATDPESFLAAGDDLVRVPKHDAILIKTPVRAVFRAPRGQSLRITLNRRVVRRVTRSGSRATASLTRRDGLRYGRNTLFVTALRRGVRVGVESRSFTLSRPTAGVARLHQRRGQVRVVAASGPSASLARQNPGAFSRALAAVRRPRHFRAWLNGRNVTGSFEVSPRGTWMNTLSATHGLRPGANRLRVLVADRASGRHATLFSTIRLPRRAPVAGAGVDQRAVVGARLRFSAGSSRLTSPRGAVRYRWRLVTRPRGSSAVLRRATTARPWVVADRSGRYRARLTVSAPRTGAGSSSDDVVATVRAESPLIDGVDTMARDADGRWGIQVGGTFYPNPSPSGAAMQVLVLDRATLQPTGDGNWYTDGTGDPQVGIPALHAHILGYNSGNNPVMPRVILAQPPTGYLPVHDENLLGLWNELLGVLGASSFPGDQVTASGASLSVIGVPYGDAGSAWQTLTSPRPFARAAALKGSFIDSAGNYAFSPRQVAFDTSSASEANGLAISNSMSVDVPGSPFRQDVLPSESGLQVLVLDGVTLEVEVDDVFQVNGAGPVSADLIALDKALAAAANAKDLVFVQTVGHATLPPTGVLYQHDPPVGKSWNAVANDLVALGASLPLVNAIDGPYTLIGGAGLGADQVVEASSAIRPQGVDPGPTRQRGYLTIDHSGRWHARLADPSGNANLKLYPVIHQAPQSWPLTGDAADPNPTADQTAYRAAMAYVTTALGFDKYGPDLRAAYYLDDNFDFETEQNALRALDYPKTNPPYTSTQFAELKSQLSTEFDLLEQVKSLFDGWKEPFLRAQSADSVDLQTLADDILKDIEVPPEDNMAFEIIDGIVGGILETIGPLGGDEVDAAVGAVTAGMEMASTISGDAGGSGSPAPDVIHAKVDELAATVADSYNANAEAMDALRDVVVSDYGKLQTMAAASKDPQWASSATQIAQVVPAVKVAAQRTFYAKLLPLVYSNFYLAAHKAPPCGNTRRAPSSSWRAVTTRFDDSGGKAVPQKDTWIIAPGTSRVGFILSIAPKLSDPLVARIGTRTRQPNSADDRDGLGLVLEQFLARSFPAPIELSC